MVSPRRFDRLMNRCPVVDCDDPDAYPLASDKELVWMEKELIRGFHGSDVFLFVRMPEGQSPYVEIYIWDPQLLEREYVRFIIREGMCLPEKLERELDWYARDGQLNISVRHMNRFCREIMRYFPQWKFHDYEVCDLGQAIDHIYYASHRSGPKEVLYKEGLYNIAYHLHEFEAYNVIGTTPAEILGLDMPRELLHVLNQPMFTVYFHKKEALEHSTVIYAYFSQYIGDRISLGQWVYLESLHKCGLGHHRLNWKVFKNLSSLNQSMSYCWQVIDRLSGMMDVFDYYGFELP